MGAAGWMGPFCEHQTGPAHPTAWNNGIESACIGIVSWQVSDMIPRTM